MEDFVQQCAQLGRIMMIRSVKSWGLTLDKLVSSFSGIVGQPFLANVLYMILIKFVIVFEEKEIFFI